MPTQADTGGAAEVAGRGTVSGDPVQNCPMAVGGHASLFSSSGVSPVGLTRSGSMSGAVRSGLARGRSLDLGRGRNRQEWTNWAGNQTVTPTDGWVRVHTEADIARAMADAITRQRSIRAIGSGHSFTAAAVADQILVDLSSYNRLLSADRTTGMVTVQSGITIAQLNRQLDELGLAMPNLGDIEYQTISGAISTGTHGTGAQLGGLATRVTEMRVVTGAGSIRTLTGDELQLAVVGLGVFGIVSTITLHCVPAFNLHVKNQPMKLDKLLDSFDEFVDGNDHFEFFWVPHTKWALTKRNNRTEEPRRPLPRHKAFIGDYVMENAAFGLVTKVGKRRPASIPKLATALPGSDTPEYVDTSWKVFTSPRMVKFVEQEYAIPRSAVPEALRAITDMVDRKGHLISFPVEVRVAAADDIALSTAHGRDSGYIAVHMVKGSDHRAYFKDVEDILRTFDGRPHWGKLHTRTYEDLAPTYKRIGEVNELRKQCDPLGLCSNDYTNQVLGPID
jgi:L-gulono-1,4-lactone dehydrogenase